jgi:hypothetical protein
MVFPERETASRPFLFPASFLRNRKQPHRGKPGAERRDIPFSFPAKACPLFQKAKGEDEQWLKGNGTI